MAEIKITLTEYMELKKKYLISIKKIIELEKENGQLRKVIIELIAEELSSMIPIG